MKKHKNNLNPSNSDRIPQSVSSSIFSYSLNSSSVV
jgi:hypothetical protein